MADVFPPPLTLSRALDLYLAHALDLSTSSVRHLRGAVRSWSRAGGPDDCRAITTESFDAYRRHELGRGLRPYTIEMAISYVVSLLRHVGPRQDRVPHGRGLIDRVPYSGRRLRRIVLPRPAVPLDDLSAIYRAAEEFRWPVRRRGASSDWWRAWLCTAYNTGLRVGDLVRLQWSQVSWKERLIEVAARKTGLPQRLPVNETLARHLETIRSDSGAVFPCRTKPEYATDRVAQMLRRICLARGITPFGPHSIRRRSGTEFERLHAGAGGLLLGHSVARGMTFSHYVGPETILRPVADRLPQPAAFLGG